MFCTTVKEEAEYFTMVRIGSPFRFLEEIGMIIKRPCAYEKNHYLTKQEPNLLVLWYNLLVQICKIK